MQLEELLERQQRSWNDDEPISIENLLVEAPDLGTQSSAIVDLIYAEMLLRENRGEHPSKEEYVARFPGLSDSIERQFQVHRALVPADQADVLTDAGGETLGESPGFAGTFAFAPPAVPGFELLEMSGRGGSGVAWRARDVKLDRTVAIKFLLDNESDSDAKGQATKERFSREATAAAKLLHPSIVQVYQVGEASGVPFLVMEYVEGGSLAEKLRSGPLPAEKSVELATSIADAVQHAHEKGVVHRDIKPGNILLGSDGLPQVCDFGLARKLDAEYSLHKTGDVLGTPAYMPPEQARGEDADERSDVYSIGAVLYESLCGRSPFQAAHPWEILYQVTTIDPLPLRQLNAAIPVELETICQKCLEKSADRRYQTAAELGEDLRRYAEGKPIHARPVSALNKASKWCLRNKAVAGLSAVSLLLLSALAVGSTFAAVKFSAANKTILAEQQLARDAEQKAINDRTVAIESLYDLINSVYDQQVAESLSLEAQEQIALAAIVGLRKITSIDGDAASMKTAILAKQRIGEIQAQRGHSDLAMTEFEEALEIAREYQQADSEDFDRKTELARVINYLVLHCNRTGQNEKAAPLVAESNLILDEQLLKEPENTLILKRWVNARSYEMDLLWRTKPPQATIDLGLESVENVKTLHEKAPDDDQSLRNVNQFYFRLGRAYMDAGQLTESESYFELGNEVLAEAMEKFPENTHLFSTSATTKKLHGLVLSYQGRYDEARTIFDAGVADASFVASLDPNNLSSKAELANVRVNRSSTLAVLGEQELAIEDLEYGISVYEKKLELAPNETSSLRTVMQCAFQSFDSLNRVGRFEDSKNAARKVIEILSREDLPPIESDEYYKWYANLTIDVLDAVEGKPPEDPTAEDRAIALFMTAFLYSERGSEESLDDEAIEINRTLEPDSTFTTVGGLFEYVNSLPLTHPLVLSVMPVMESRIYARQAALLDGSDSKTEADQTRIDELKQKAIDLLVPFSKTSPTAISQIHQEPDFIWLRKTDAFAEQVLNGEQ